MRNNQIVQQTIRTVDGKQFTKTYRILEVLGQGCFSKCYKVKPLNSEKIFALKQISKAQLKLLEQQKLCQQIRIHQSLLHPYIVHLDHQFEDSAYQYILLQYCSNGTLQSRSPKMTELQQTHIVKYTRQILASLKYLHSKNIIHRDLKLPNFFIDSNDDIKLGDFGFACKLSYDEELRRETCGTPNYIAPEVVSGFGYSLSSDLWAFGVILYRLKFGCCPFEGKSLNETLIKVKTAEYSFPKNIPISRELKGLIKGLLVLNYDDRLKIAQIQAHPFYRETKQIKVNKEQGYFSNISKAISQFFTSKSQTQLTKRTCQLDRRDIKKIFKQKSQDYIHALTQQRIQSGGLTTRRLDSEPASGYLKNKVVSQAYIRHPEDIKIEIQSNNTNKLITQKFSVPVLFRIERERDYIFCYLSNGIRQILTKDNIYIISQWNSAYDTKGNIIQNLPKVIAYMIANALKPNPFHRDLKSFQGAIKNGHFIREYKKCIENRLLLNMNSVHFMTTESDSIFIIYYKNYEYFYNDRLQIVKEVEIGKGCRKSIELQKLFSKKTISKLNIN